MAKLNKEDFINALKEMTILEVKELVDAMKEVGDKMDFSLRETALGGLAKTPEGLKISASCTKI